MYITKKMVKGRTYYQVVMSKRDRETGRVGHVLLGTLGTHPTIEEARSAALERYVARGRRDEDWERVDELDDLDRWYKREKHKREKRTTYQPDPAVSEERSRRYLAERQQRRAANKEKRERRREDDRRCLARFWGLVAAADIVRCLLLLGLPTEEQIKAAFRKILNEHKRHPDRGSSDEAFIELQDARDRLIDWVRRGCPTDATESRPAAGTPALP